MRLISLLILFIQVSIQLIAQPGEWQAYTSKNNINDIFFKNGKLWTATTGGVFYYDTLTKSFGEFTTLNGLKSTFISSVFIDEQGDIWIGAQNGYLHYLKNNKKWIYFNDIYFSSEINKDINSFLQYKDTMYICSEIGLHTLLIEEGQFSDSYVKFGISPQINGKVNSVLILNDTIWVATKSGIAQSIRSYPNLLSPEVWKVYTTLHGLPSDNVISIFIIRGEIYAATTNGLAKFNGANWTPIFETYGKKIIDIDVIKDTIFFVTSSELYKMSDYSLNLISNNFQSKLKSLKVTEEDIFIGTEDFGIICIQDTSRFSILPDCPPTNNLIGLAVDGNGVLWAGTGTANGKGFIRFENNSWYQYNYTNYPILGSPNYYKANIGMNNVKWINGWGPGIALVGADNEIKKVLNTKNGLPSSVVSDPNYVVCSGAVTDNNGRVWISIFNERKDTVLVIFNPDSSLEYLISPLSFISTGITIDHYGTKWFWTGRNGGGIFFYNEKDTIRGMQPGTRWGRVTKSNGLNSDNVSVIAVDRNGEIWVGTMDAGINIIYDATNPLNRIAVYSPLRGQKINDILVDPLNQKWVATSLGVYVLNPDGTAILQQYTFENTNGKLLDNNVISIAMNNNDGTIYFGTEKGLSVLKTYSITPVQNFTELKISPNPFIINSHNQIFIDGLVEKSSIKIISSSGELIRNLESPGGRLASWDGCDLNGNKVSSGIYIIIASADDESKIGLGKIAVIK